jgi:hypothetical protein
MLDAGVVVDLHVFLIPSGLQWHCPGTAMYVVIVVLQTTQAVALRPDAVPKTDR